MPSPSPFTFTVYDKAFDKKGTVGNPLSLSFTSRHNQQPTGQLILAADHPRTVDLTTSGCRYVLHYQGEHLSSGVITQRAAKGPSRLATITFQLTDDWWLFSRMLAWPNPGSAVDAQTTNEYDTRTGAAETVLKAIVSANKGHLVDGPSITVATDLGRGSSITVANRFHPLTDRLMPAVDGAGIGTTVRQVGAGLVVDCYTSEAYPRTLTESSGTVREFEWSSIDPKVSRAIVGGKGEGTARAFRRRIDAARDAEYGYTVEALKDATDLDTAGELDARGDEFLAENRPTNGISVKLAETSSFRYDPSGARGLRVGDVIEIQVIAGVTIPADVLRECTVTWSADGGLTVTPQVGDRSNDPGQTLARAFGSLMRAFRNTITRS